MDYVRLGRSGLEMSRLCLGDPKKIKQNSRLPA